MKTKLLTLCGVVLAALVYGPAAAQADPAISFVLDDAQIGAPGTSVNFFGVITNTGTSTVFLNGVNLTLSGAGLVGDDTPFFNNVPASLGPGGSTGAVAMLSVVIGAGAVPGTYTGTMTVIGGLTADAQVELGTQDFQVVVVPEPATIVLLGSGLAGAAIARRRRRARPDRAAKP